MFNLAVMLSLAIGVVVTDMWVRGRRSAWVLEFGAAERRWDVRSWNGRLSVTNTPQVVRDWRAYQSAHDQFVQRRRELALRHRELVARLADAEFGSSRWETLRAAQRQYVDDNFDLVAPPRNIRARQEVGMSCWALLVGSLVLPAMWAGARGRRAYAARQQARVGLCKRCGYDLRATPAQCPECGAVPV